MPALILPLVEAATHLPARGALSASTSAARPSESPPAIPTGGSRPASRRWRAGNFATDAARLLALGGRAQGGRLRARPADQHGRQRGPARQSTRAFARNLARLTELPIALWDERLSTAAVERALIAADVSRARRAKVIDQHAAAFILQGALDRLRRLDCGDQ